MIEEVFYKAHFLEVWELIIHSFCINLGIWSKIKEYLKNADLFRLKLDSKETKWISFFVNFHDFDDPDGTNAAYIDWGY